jgi:hypothetical protein
VMVLMETMAMSVESAVLKQIMDAGQSSEGGTCSGRQQYVDRDEGAAVPSLSPTKKTIFTHSCKRCNARRQRPSI